MTYSHSLNNLKIQVRVFDVYSKLIYKYGPPSTNSHNKPFYVLNDGDHIYVLDNDLYFATT